MFIAIIIPPSKKEKSVALTCLLSIALSALFYYTPVLSKLSGGYTLILITVAVSALMAWLFPRKEEENV
jgi:fucose permease